MKFLIYCIVHVADEGCICACAWEQQGSLLVFAFQQHQLTPCPLGRKLRHGRACGSLDSGSRISCVSFMEESDAGDAFSGRELHSAFHVAELLGQIHALAYERESLKAEGRAKNSRRIQMLLGEMGAVSLKLLQPTTRLVHEYEAAVRQAWLAAADQLGQDAEKDLSYGVPMPPGGLDALLRALLPCGGRAAQTEVGTAPNGQQEEKLHEEEALQDSVEADAPSVIYGDAASTINGGDQVHSDGAKDGVGRPHAIASVAHNETWPAHSAAVIQKEGLELSQQEQYMCTDATVGPSFANATAEVYAQASPDFMHGQQHHQPQQPQPQQPQQQQQPVSLSSSANASISGQISELRAENAALLQVLSI